MSYDISGRKRAEKCRICGNVYYPKEEGGGDLTVCPVCNRSAKKNSDTPYTPWTNWH